MQFFNHSMFPMRICCWFSIFFCLILFILIRSFHFFTLTAYHADIHCNRTSFAHKNRDTISFYFLHFALYAHEINTDWYFHTHNIKAFSFSGFCLLNISMLYQRMNERQNVRFVCIRVTTFTLENFHANGGIVLVQCITT